MVSSGELVLPDDELVADILNGRSIFANAGFEHIDFNWAKNPSFSPVITRSTGII